MVKDFVSILRKYELTDMYKAYEKNGTLTSLENMRKAIGFITMETNARMDPFEIEKLLLLEWEKQG